MAKRASIKGRGADILFGEKGPPKKPALEIGREVDIEKSLGEEVKLAEPALDAELEKAFGEEVMAMEPVPPTPVTPAGVSAPPRATEIVSPPLEVPPSPEPRRVSVTLKVEEPSPPSAAPAPRVEEAPPTPTYYPSVTPAPTVEAPSPPEMPPRRWEEAAYGHLPVCPSQRQPKLLPLLHQGGLSSAPMIGHLQRSSQEGISWSIRSP